jgi:hypothetical protein
MVYRFGAMASAVLSFTSHAAAQHYALVPCEQPGIVGLFDRKTGELMDSRFIDLTEEGIAHAAIRAAIPVENEIWVVDQGLGRIHRFTNEGFPIYIGSTSPLNAGQINAITHANGAVYAVASGVAGINGPHIIRLAPNGQVLGTFPVRGGSDILYVDGGNNSPTPSGLDELLLTNAIENCVDRYNGRGEFLGSISLTPPGPQFRKPLQLSLTPSNTLLVAASGPPSGVFEFTFSGGFVSMLSVDAPRGALRMANGDLLFSDAQGVHVRAAATGVISAMWPRPDLNAWFITPIDVFLKYCPSDFNGDGFVDFFDFDDYVACYEGGNGDGWGPDGEEGEWSGPCPPNTSADFNLDGFIDFFDLDEFIANFARSCD